ncbi:short chain dehydrogenase [Sinomonas terrae]|uniref:Short chain dehydrogenase n=1 Tax=Sinomonas terrae TaxID=2908838 RepID=A0ABS9U7F7_9MICC|nr:short chain dehydrogenase [Sinomonas terrae]MCH6472442.1 short chain dehydrogenase [Sinomonas terrae]
MRILLVGSTGTIGSAVQQALTERGHEVLGASRSSTERPVEISDPESIARLIQNTGPVEAIACAAGHAAYGRVTELTGDQYRASFESKSMGQIRLVLEGLGVLARGGSFTLISGVLGTHPVVTSSAAAAANGAVEAFARAAALEIAPARINVVSPTVLSESWEKAGHMFPGVEPVPARRVANAYVRSIEGAETGQVYQLF